MNIQPIFSTPASNPVAERHPDIAALVAHFYASARADALIGPIFEAGVEDWPHHLRSLTAFWAAQLRGRGAYRGQPLAAHRRHAARMRPEMFDRWLALWRQATETWMSPADAEALQAKAAGIAQVLRAALWEEEPAKKNENAGTAPACPHAATSEG